MEEFEFVPTDGSTFVGRKRELTWLDARLGRGHGTSLQVIGAPGVGKSALTRQWVSSRAPASVPLWVDLDPPRDPQRDASAAIDAVVGYLQDRRHRADFIVVLNGAEFPTVRSHDEAVGRILNFKAVRSLVVTARASLPVSGRTETLGLGPLLTADATELFEKLSPAGVTPELVRRAVDAAQGYPLAIRLLAETLQSGSEAALRELVGGQVYDLSRTIAVPTNELARAVAPKIITAHGALIDALKRQPQQIHALSPRKFEELLADLLSDMGWDVELTQETRDGGKDILAYLNTDLGRLLCLVEAKHYRQDRKVGVEVVRTLYGTLCDAEANSAMLVTSSSFSPDAKEFQKRHSYQLQLRDYADLVNWIVKYGTAQKGG